MKANRLAVSLLASVAVFLFAGGALAEPRGSVFLLGAGASYPGDDIGTVLPYAQIGYEYHFAEKMSAGLKGIVATDGSLIVGNPMAAFNYMVTESIRTSAMIGYGNFSEFGGWGKAGFSWGLSIGFRLISSATYLDLEMLFSYTGLTSYQTGHGSTGIFPGLGLLVGFDI